MGHFIFPRSPSVLVTFPLVVVTALEVSEVPVTAMHNETEMF